MVRDLLQTRKYLLTLLVSLFDQSQFGKCLTQWLSGKEATCNAGDAGDVGSWIGNSLWRRTWQPTPVVLPGESHGQSSLVGYSPQGHKESDMIEVTGHTSILGWTLDQREDFSGNSAKF